MRRVIGDESETKSKSQLVTEICNLSKRAIPCSQSHCERCPIDKSPFIDWYILLQVEDNAGIDVIRRQYRKLALQLHPDKNKHPKAEIAFKLVSEAYECLSDNARRSAFDLERWNSFCIKCDETRISHMTCKPPVNCTAKPKGSLSAEKLRSNKILRGLKDVRARFMEEASVIKRCLKVNAAARKESPTSPESTGKEYPVFNPLDYPLRSGYPHHRTRDYKKHESFRCLKTRNKYEQGRWMGDSPIFEIRSEREPKFRSVSQFITLVE